MKKLLFIFAIATMLISCKKSTETKTAEFVKMYNNTSDIMVRTAKFKSTKASSTADGNVDIEIHTNYLKNDIEADLMKNAIPDIIGQAIQAEASGKELLNEGVKFNLKVFATDGTKLSEQIIDKNTKKGNIDLQAIADGKKPDNAQLNEILKSFSKGLPIVDASTGTKIVNISADAENNIVYTAEVPDTYADIIGMEGTDKVMKDAIAKSPEVRQMFAQTNALGVENLKYIYKDKKGKTLKEITVSKNDIN